MPITYSGQLPVSGGAVLASIISDPGFCAAVNACVASSGSDDYVVSASVAGTTLSLTRSGGGIVAIDLAPAVIAALGSVGGADAVVAAASAGLVTGVGIKGNGTVAAPYEFAASELPTDATPVISAILAATTAKPDGASLTLAQLGAALTAAGAVSVGSTVENANGTVNVTLNAVTSNSVRVIGEQAAASGAPAASDLFTMLVGGNHVAVTVTQLATALSAILPDVKLQTGVYNAGTKAIDFTLSNGSVVSVPVAALLPVSVTNSIQGDGSTTALSLVGDVAAPGNTKYYGTNGAGAKGWNALPSTPLAAVAPPADAAAGVVGVSTDAARADHVHPLTHSLTAAASAITSDVDGVTATLTPAAGVIAQSLGFNAAGELVKGAAGSVAEVAATGTVDTTIAGVTGNAILSIPELTLLPAGTIDKANDLVVVWDTSAAKHVKAPASDIGNTITVNYWETVTAAAPPVADAVTLSANDPQNPQYGGMWLHDGQAYGWSSTAGSVASALNTANSEQAVQPSLSPIPLPHSTYWHAGGTNTGIVGQPVGYRPIFSKFWRNRNLAFALDQNQKIWFKGTNNQGQSGIPALADTVAEQWLIVDFFVTAGINIVDMAVGEGDYAFTDYNSSVFAITSTGTVYSWGGNEWGQLGRGNTATQATPAQVTLPLGTQIVKAQLSANNGGQGVHSMLLSSTGILFVAGYNGNGQHGLGNTTQQTLFLQSATGVADFTLAAQDSFYIRAADGAVFTAGQNDSGSHGRGIATATTTWAQAVSINEPAAKIVVVKHGGNSTYIIDSTGDLWVCGNNANGQLGLGGGNQTQQNSCTKLSAAQLPIQGLIKEVHVSGNAQRTAFVISTAGDVYSAGANQYGNRGIGSGNSTALQLSTWRQLPFPAKVITARCAAEQNTASLLALDENNDLWTWGISNQLPNGNGISGSGSLATTPLKVLWPRNQGSVAVVPSTGPVTAVTNADGSVTVNAGTGGAATVHGAGPAPVLATWPAQAIPNNVVTPITGWVEVSDVSSAFNPVTGVYTAPVTGWYQVQWDVIWGSGAWAASTSMVGMVIDSAAAELAGGGVIDYVGVAVAASPLSFKGQVLVRLTAGSAYRLAALQTSGAAKTFQVVALRNALSISYIHA